MNNKKIIYDLMRENEYVLGSNKLTVLALDSFIKSIKELKAENITKAKKNFDNLIVILLNSEPKVTPLIHLIEDVSYEIEQMDHIKKVSDLKRAYINALKDKKKIFKDKIMKTINHGLKKIKNNDTIIVHSVSSVVLNILIMARKKGMNFKVLVLKQDDLKTERILKVLTEHGIDYEVFPEYNLCHVIEKANKLFIGSISITSNKKVVSAIGTSNIVNSAYLEKLPITLFINSLKFSHCCCSDQKVQRLEKNRGKNVKYKVTAFSHDFVPLNKIKTIITEDGVINNKKILEYTKCSRKKNCK